MELQVIEQDFRKSVGEKVSLLREGNERYRVFTPFLFEDGDHLSIVFKRVGRHWVLSDEGNTLMRLTYEIDLRDLLRGNRQKIIDGALNTYGVANQEGELVFVVRDDAYGDALFSFVQSLIKISDVTYLSRERAKSTFLDDFRQLMQEAAPAERLEFDYHDPRHDPEGIYTVDCRVNHMARPLFAFAVPGDDRCRDVTITLLQFERWGMEFQSLAVFEDQQAISRPVLARFSDVADKQFSSLVANRERVKRYLTDTLSSAH
jgi:hypothetical protein